MVVPDMEQICEIMLLSEGFDGAKVGRACRGWCVECPRQGRGCLWPDQSCA